MKRTRTGMMLQGSLELGGWPALIHSQVEIDFLNLLSNEVGEELNPQEWPLELEKERMEQVKIFQSPAWNLERKSVG